MPKNTEQATGAVRTGENSTTGQPVTVRGAGALKGQLVLKKGIDLTKPIAAQVLKTRKSASGTKR